MPPQTLDRRVESLEKRVTVLEQLPARVDHLAVQLSQLRDEMRAEFSAVRSGITAGDDRVVRSLREEIREGDERVVRSLREEIRAVAEEIMAHARMLHEDALSRIALIGEGRPSQRGRTKRR
jgi:hypothetical protein